MTTKSNLVCVTKHKNWIIIHYLTKSGGQMKKHKTNQTAKITDHEIVIYIPYIY